MWLLTAAWLLILIAVIGFSAPCDPLASLWRPDTRYLTCMQANEIGDFLAGAFAPHAFFWLIATVVIKARELRAQRQELHLTRREFEANRKVAEAQAPKPIGRPNSSERRPIFCGQNGHSATLRFPM